MTPSAYEKSTMTKSTATNPTTTNNTAPSSDHSKTQFATNASTPKNSNYLIQKLQQNTVNNWTTTLKDDETMPSSDDHPEKDIITSVNDNLTKLNPYNTDMRDRMIKHASEIKFVKDRYTTTMVVEFSSPLKSGNNTNQHCIHSLQDFRGDETPRLITQIITQDGQFFEHSKDFPTGN